MRIRLHILRPFGQLILALAFVAIFLSCPHVEAAAKPADHSALGASPFLQQANRPLSGPIEVLSEGSLYFLKIDLRDSRVHVRVGLANNDTGGYETLSSMKNRYSGRGYAEWAVINGDYFGSGCPSNVNCAQGLTYIDGQRKDNWSAYGTTWPVRGNLGFDGSNGVQIAIGDAQGKRHMTIAGGPWIVKDGGAPTCQADLISGTTYFSTGEQFTGDQRWYCTTTGALTMVGYSSDRRYLYIGVSSGGMTVVQVGQWLKDRGAFDVLKLDGGGSSGIYYNGTLIKGSGSRAIVNHLALVVDDAPPPTATPQPPVATPTPVPAGLEVIEGLTLSASTPLAGEPIAARFKVRNSGSGAIALRRIGVGSHGPNCSTWDCPSSVDWPWEDYVTLQPGQEFAFTRERAFTATGSGYFAQITYTDMSDNWRQLGQRIDFTVQPGLSVVTPLTLTPATPFAGQYVTATFSLRNLGSRAITLQRLAVGGRGPGDVDAGWEAFSNLTIAPGQTYYYSARRTFDAAGSYYAEPMFEDSNGWWLVAPGGTRTTFAVTPGVAVLEDLTLSPSDPLAGETVTARIRIQNQSAQSITLRSLGVAAKGPNCSDWDCANTYDFPFDGPITLAAGQTYTFSRQRVFPLKGGGYFAHSTYTLTDDSWHPIGSRRTFTVQPGLIVVAPVTLIPATPCAGQYVTATFSLKNEGVRAIEVRRMAASARSPDGANVDWAPTGSVVLAPNVTYQYQMRRPFEQAGTGYWTEPVFEESNGWWLPLPGGVRTNFSVTPGIEIIQDLALNPTDPLAGEAATATFKVKNRSSQALTLRSLGVAAKGPNCTDWDCPNSYDFPFDGPLTLAAGQEYTYSRQRVFPLKGSGYFAQSTYTLADESWHPIGTRRTFSVQPGLEVVEALVLTPTTPLPGQQVAAQYTVKNVGPRALTLRGLGVVSRGPGCSQGWECSSVLDFPMTETMTLQPGQTFQYSGQRSYSNFGTYFAEPAFTVVNWWWHPITGGRRIDFTVGSAADAYETNDICTAAKSIATNGSLQVHNFHRPNDTDWVHFEAAAGTSYRIQATIPAGSPADLRLELYRTCTGTPITTWDETFSPGVQIDFEAPADGSIFLRLTNRDGSIAGANVTYQLSVRAQQQASGAAIVVAGRYRSADPLQPNIYRVTNGVYELLAANNYTSSDVYLLAPEPGVTGFDALSTVENVRYAITTWARNRLTSGQSLMLYFVDHGEREVFYVDRPGGQEVTPGAVDTWLSQLEDAVPGVKINIVVEACHSGSFIAHPESISKPGRVVVASTNIENDAYASGHGAYFSDHYLSALARGMSLGQGFSEARWAVREISELQDPWLDADGDGVPNEAEDLSLAGQRSYPSAAVLSGDSIPPFIVRGESPCCIASGSGTIRAEVIDDLDVARVWAVIYPPSYRPPADGVQLVPEDMDVVELQRNAGDNYTGQYTGFHESGTYRIVIHAVDQSGNVSRPVAVETRAGRAVFLPLIWRGQ